MKYHSKLTITNMFTVDLNSSKHGNLAPPPPPPSTTFNSRNNTAASNYRPTTPPVTTRTLPSAPRAASRLESARSSSIARNPTSNIPMNIRTPQSRDWNENENSIGFFNPFPSISQDYSKTQFTASKPPLPVQTASAGTMPMSATSLSLAAPESSPSRVSPRSSYYASGSKFAEMGTCTEGTRPSTPCPVVRSYHNSRENTEAYQNRMANNFGGGLPTPMMATARTNDSASTQQQQPAKTKFPLGGMFQPGQAQAKRESARKATSKEQYYRNLRYGFEDDVASSGLFLMNGGNGRSGEGGGEAPRMIPSRVLSYEKAPPPANLRTLPPSPPSVTINYPPPQNPFPQSTTASGLQSFEALKNLQKPSSDLSRRAVVAAVENEAVSAPNEIQEDLLRIEMLMELRKYKRAMNAQRQAQQRLMHMCNDQNLNSEQLALESPQLSPAVQNTAPRYLRSIMDQLHDQENANGSRGGGETAADVQQDGAAALDKADGDDDDKPWEFDLATQVLNSSFMEPHMIRPGDEAEQKFRSQLNPLIAAAREQYNAALPPKIPQSESKRQQLEPKTRSSAEVKSTVAQPAPQSTQGAYEQFVAGRGQLLEGLDNFSPTSGFKLASARPTQSTLPSDRNSDNNLFQEMLRKPVSISKQRSPLQVNTSATRLTPLNLIQLPPSHHQQKQHNPERPSPFFPGLSSQIEMKIRSPNEVRMQQRRSDEDSRGKEADDLEELGNLLSQLPVLSRQQKVEEFANKMIPPSPLTDVDSEVSMVPHVSSNGTLTTPDGQALEGRNQTTEAEAEEQNEFGKVDTNKMSISELVTLGRKIYNILSQLSNNNSQTTMESNEFAQMQCPTNAPFITESLKNQMKGLSNGGMNAMVFAYDSNDNPSFVTGPGQASPRKMPLHKPPTSANRYHQPPPTRWEKRSGSLNPPSSPILQNEFQHRRSNSSMPAISRSGSRNQHQYPIRVNLRGGIGIEEEKNVMIPTSPKYSPHMRHKYNSFVENAPRNFNQRLPRSLLQTVQEFHELNKSKSKTSKRNFIHENIMKAKLMKKLSEARTVRPKPLPAVGKKYENIRSVIGSRSRSREREGNAGENSTTVADDRKRATSLPANFVEVPSRSKSPLRYTHRFQALKVNGPGSISSNPSTARSTAYVSIESKSPPPPPPVTSKNQNLSQMKMVKTVQSIMRNSAKKSRSVVEPPSKVQSVASKIAAAAATPYKPSPSLVMANKTYSLSGNTSGIQGSVGRFISRKCRSKTKRESVIAKEFRNASSSSVQGQDQEENVKPANSVKSNIAGALQEAANSGSVISAPEKKSEAEVKSKTILRKSKAQKVLGEVRLYEVEAKNTTLKGAFNSSSEQELIREMVKAEMNLMVEKHVKDVLKQRSLDGQQKTSQERVVEAVAEGQKKKQQEKPPRKAKENKSSQVKKGQPPPLSDESEFEHITPVYTPPRAYDESLFALEKWINPELTMPGTAYTSAKETPATTADNGSGGEGGNVKKGRSQTVRFSIPLHESRKISNNKT